MSMQMQNMQQQFSMQQQMFQQHLQMQMAAIERRAETSEGTFAGSRGGPKKAATTTTADGGGPHAPAVMASSLRGGDDGRTDDDAGGTNLDRRPSSSCSVDAPFYASSSGHTSMLHVLSRSMPNQKVRWLMFTVPCWTPVRPHGERRPAGGERGRSPATCSSILSGHVYHFHRTIWPKMFLRRRLGGDYGGGDGNQAEGERSVRVEEAEGEGETGREVSEEGRK
ncbi:hypothetical protein ACHAW5_002176 [Stephanodiscus triporus]|uniref:Uncharacterized protein n=1 Tax=Stephanodiscus triporus TaxID=2934178 RepID=A0ABD3P640_9STRA